MLMRSYFVCATLNLGRKKSTGTESKVSRVKIFFNLDLVAKIKLYCHLLNYFIVYQVRMLEGWRVQRKYRLNIEVT